MVSPEHVLITVEKGDRSSMVEDGIGGDDDIDKLLGFLRGQGFEKALEQCVGHIST